MEKILFLVPLPPPNHGAAFSNELTVRSKKIQGTYNVHVIPMNFNRGFGDFHRFKWSKLIIAARIAITLFYKCIVFRPAALYFTPSLDMPAILRDAVYIGIARLCGVQILLHVRGSGLYERAESSDLIRKIYKFIYRNAKVITLAETLYEQDFRHFSEVSDVIAVSNGRPDPYADGGAPPDRSSRSQPPVILFLSNMFVMKGPLILLKALGVLKARSLSFQAKFVGPFCEDDLEEKFWLQVKEEGLADCLEHVGAIYGAEKDAAYQGADIFAFPSLREAFGVVLIEAASHGLPAVAFAEGGIPDVIADKETGLLCEKFDPIDMADKLEQLIMDIDKRCEMGAAGRERFLQEFTLSAYETNVYNAICNHLN